ncbi:MAG: hypothetical protein CME05_11950 [Gemmatimonadaceae bacterium]|nr:hypothetical protein [Gemmatimonadaceae bacterium]
MITRKGPAEMTVVIDLMSPFRGRIDCLTLLTEPVTMKSRSPIPRKTTVFTTIYPRRRSLHHLVLATIFEKAIGIWDARGPGAV